MESSAFGRILSVLVSPEKTFRAIADRPTIAVVLILVILLGAGANLLLFSKVDGEEMIRYQMEQSGREVSEQEMEVAISIGEKMKYITPIAAIVFVPIFFMIGAAIFMVVFRLQGSEINFKESLSTILHGTLPGAVKALLMIPIVLGRSQIDFVDVQMQTLVASNLAMFAPEDASVAMVTLLTSVDVFSVWSIILLAIGYRIVGKVSAATAGVTVSILWIVAVALKIGMAALGS